MKLKDIILLTELEPNIQRNYNDYIESDIPENSIEIDTSGRIVSDRLSLLNFIQFLLSEYDYLPENNSNDEFDNDGHKLKKKKSKKKKRNNDFAKGLTLRQKKKRIQNLDHFLNSKSNYPI